MGIQSFTVNFARERIDIRFDDDTERRLSYRDLYPGILERETAEATTLEIENDIASQKEAIQNLSKPEKTKVLMMAELGTVAKKEAIARRITNRKRAVQASQKTNEELAAVLNLSRKMIQEVVSRDN